MKTKAKKLDEIFQTYSEEKGFEFKLLKYKTLEVLRHCQGPNVLDLGCGVGILTEKLGEKFKKVVGVDGSFQKIAIAQKYNYKKNIIYVNSLFEDYTPKQLFDTIVMTNVLEHLNNPPQFLKKIKKFLKKNGRVIVTVPNALALHKKLGKEMGIINDFYVLTPKDKTKGHFQIYDEEKLRKDFKKAGYKIKYMGGIFLKPVSSSQMENFDDAVLDGLYKLGKQYPALCSSLMVVAGI